MFKLCSFVIHELGSFFQSKTSGCLREKSRCIQNIVPCYDHIDQKLLKLISSMFSISFINLPTSHSFYQIENFAAVARNYVCDIPLSYHVLHMEKNTCSKKKSTHCTISRSSGQSDLAMTFQRSLIIWPMTEEFSFLFPSGVFLLTV